MIAATTLNNVLPFLPHFPLPVSIWFVNPHNIQFQTLSVMARFMYIFVLAICMKLASDLLKQ